MRRRLLAVLLIGGLLVAAFAVLDPSNTPIKTGGGGGKTGGAHTYITVERAEAVGDGWKTDYETGQPNDVCAITDWNPGNTKNFDTGIDGTLHFSVFVNLVASGWADSSGFYMKVERYEKISGSWRWTFMGDAGISTGDAWSGTMEITVDSTTHDFAYRWYMIVDHDDMNPLGGRAVMCYDEATFYVN